MPEIFWSMRNINKRLPPSSLGSHRWINLPSSIAEILLQPDLQVFQSPVDGTAASHEEGAAGLGPKVRSRCKRVTHGREKRLVAPLLPGLPGGREEPSFEGQGDPQNTGHLEAESCKHQTKQFQTQNDFYGFFFFFYFYV